MHFVLILIETPPERPDRVVFTEAWVTRRLDGRETRVIVRWDGKHPEMLPNLLAETKDLTPLDILMVLGIFGVNIQKQYTTGLILSEICGREISAGLQL